MKIVEDDGDEVGVGDGVGEEEGVGVGVGVDVESVKVKLHISLQSLQEVSKLLAMTLQYQMPGDRDGV